jgi:hydrogenase expression/formation protein HypC
LLPFKLFDFKFILVYMCLATPLQIKRIEKDTAFVDHEKREYPVSLQLIPTAKVGDWILAHGEIGISILPEKEARDILKLIEKANHKA